MRGKRCCCCCVRCFSRITPAGAGKTGIYIYGTMDSEDHPRRCGENGRIRLPFTADTGSPPQVRGKPIPKYVNASLIRITPAGAGKTLAQIRTTCAIWDHPRRCGENPSCSSVAMGKPGSPPQVRGKHLPSISLLFSSGITPAGAGKTFNPFTFQ